MPAEGIVSLYRHSYGTHSSWSHVILNSALRYATYRVLGLFPLALVLLVLVIVCIAARRRRSNRSQR